MHCFDNNYVIPAGVAFYSMLENADRSYDYKLYVLHSGITKENQELLLKTVNKFPNATLEFVDMNNKFDDLFKKTNSKGHFSKEMYYKFLAPSIFKQYEKIIISDVDVVYFSDISQAFESLSIEEDYYIYGADNCKVHNIEFKKQTCKNYTQEEIDSLLTKAGFWVYNLKKMRQDNLEEKFVNYALKNTHRLVLPEQDTVNIICYPKIKIMPDNMLVCAHECKKDISKQELKNIIQFHYAMAQKPWKNNCLHANLWFEYLLKTPLFEAYMEILEKKFNPKIKTILSFSLPFYKKKFSLIKTPKN